MLHWITALLLPLVLCSEPSLESHVIPLYGNTSVGIYYANIFMGTPPQKQSVIINTGGVLLAVPCEDCPACGNKHLNPFFKSSQSKTNTRLTCVQIN